MVKGFFLLMLLVLLHEFGHFIAAKRVGIPVEEFSIGFGPTIFKHQGKETLFSIRLFPLGGYCSLMGEDGAQENGGFYKVRTRDRLLVLAAGPLMNLLVGFLFVFLIILFSTTPAYAIPVSDGGMIEPTDRIVQIDDFHIYTVNDILYAEAFNKTGEYTVVIDRDGEKITLENYRPVRGSLLGEGNVKLVQNTIPSKIEFSIRNCASMIQNVILSLKHLVLGDFGVKDLSGPLGIANSFKGTTLTGTLTLMAFISINLGILNLLPIPALDGGQILIALLEKALKKKFNEKIVATLNFVFLVLLLILISVISVSDIAKLIS